MFILITAPFLIEYCDLVGLRRDIVLFLTAKNTEYLGKISETRSSGQELCSQPFSRSSISSRNQEILPDSSLVPGISRGRGRQSHSGEPSSQLRGYTAPTFSTQISKRVDKSSTSSKDSSDMRFLGIPTLASSRHCTRYNMDGLGAGNWKFGSANKAIILLKWRAHEMVRLEMGRAVVSLIFLLLITQPSDCASMPILDVVDLCGSLLAAETEDSVKRTKKAAGEETS